MHGLEGPSALGFVSDGDTHQAAGKAEHPKPSQTATSKETQAPEATSIEAPCLRASCRLVGRAEFSRREPRGSLRLGAQIEHCEESVSGVFCGAAQDARTQRITQQLAYVQRHYPVRAEHCARANAFWDHGLGTAPHSGCGLCLVGTVSH